MKKIIATTLMIAALAACQKSEEQSPEMGGSSEVTFTSAISTRATGTSWDASDQIGVFMYETASTTIYDIDSENVLYSTSGGESATFTSVDPLIFPKYAYVDYIAYHPYTTNYSDNIITLNTADQSSETKVKAQDFMVASVQSCSEETTPTLSFRRKMSKIVVEVDRRDTREDAVLSDISLSSIKVDGTFFIINTPSNGRDNASVEVGSTTSDISLFFNETSSVIEAIIIPQTTTATGLIVTIDGIEYAAPICSTFEENKQYSYTLTLGIDRADFSEGTITDWTELDKGELPID